MTKMKIKSIAPILIAVLLTSIVAVLVSFTPSVSAEGAVYINSNYTFVSDIYEPIVVIGDNLVIDGAGHTLQGSGDGIGILLNGRCNVIIKNVRITGFFHAIVLYASKEILLIENTIEDNWPGPEIIDIRDCHRCKVISNTFSNNQGFNIKLTGSSYNIIEGNDISSNEGVGIAIESSSNNNIIIDNIASQNTGNGIYVDYYCFNNVVSRNTFNYNVYNGIEVADNSNDNTVTDNTVIGNGQTGILLHRGSSNITLARNVVVSNLQGGISIGDSSYNKVCQNSLIDNGMAIGIVSDYNIVFNNMFSKNGLSVCGSSYNLIEGNSFDYDESCGIGVGIGSSNNIIVNNVVCWLEVNEGSNNNIIIGNKIEGIEGSQLRIGNDANHNLVSNNNLTEINVDYSSGNLIYHNNIDRGAHDTNPTSNFWHHPALLEGNYWSGYPGFDDGSGTDKHAIAGDGIGDTYIPWPQEDYDYYPFTMSFDWKLHTVLAFDPSSSSVVSINNPAELTVHLTVATLAVKELPITFSSDPPTLTFSNVVNPTNASGYATVTTTPYAAGVYIVTAKVPGTTISDTWMLAVYDPSAGFVTGGGWIESPEGAYQADPTLSGKATFGFVSKYQKGANIPTGKT
jgi:parallel beta-helix repeat protein